MLSLIDVKRLPIPGQFIAFAEAYIESAEFLCANLCTKDAGMTYAHGAVVLSLTFHSCELFLKAAILQKVPNEQFSGNTGHNLGHLRNRYASLFPEKNWALDLPFSSDIPDLKGLDARIAEELIACILKGKKTMPEDQVHRYPTDRQGQLWNGAFGFEPNSFLLEITRIKSEFSRVKAELQHG